MKSKLIMCAAFTASLFASSAVFAQSSQTTEDVVNFLVNSADMGASRGICIGTAEECGQTAEKAQGLDMLINFNLDSAELTDTAAANLEKFAKALKDQRLAAAKFVIEGHTDASGGESYNQSLSEKRANAVTSFLVSRGITSSKLQAKGIGESNPREADPLSPANRRVEIKVRLQ